MKKTVFQELRQVIAEINNYTVLDKLNNMPKLKEVLLTSNIEWTSLKTEGFFAKRDSLEQTWKKALLNGILKEKSVLIEISQKLSGNDYIIKYENNEYEAKNLNNLEAILSSIYSGNTEYLDTVDEVYNLIKKNKLFIFNLLKKYFLPKVNWDLKLFKDKDVIYFRIFTENKETQITKDLLENIKKYFVKLITAQDININVNYLIIDVSVIESNTDKGFIIKVKGDLNA